MTALPPPYPDGLAIIDLIRQECSRLDAVIGGQRYAHHRPLIFHDPPDADAWASERAAIDAHGNPTVLPRLIAAACNSSFASCQSCVLMIREIQAPRPAKAGDGASGLARGPGAS